MRENTTALEAYESLMADLREVQIDLEEKFELPPCSITTTIYKPFQFQMSNTDMVNPNSSSNVLN